MTTVSFEKLPDLLPAPKSWQRRLTIASLVFVPFLYACLGIYLGQDVSWDFRNYHWYNAWAFSTGRYHSEIDFMPSQLQYFLNPLADLIFYYLTKIFSLKISFFVMGLIQGLNFIILFFLSQSLLKIESLNKKTALSLILSVMGMMGSTAISEAGSVIHDNFVSLGILLSLFFVAYKLNDIYFLNYKALLRNFFLFGIPAGMATGLKMTSGPFCLGLCMAFFFINQPLKKILLVSFFFGLGILFGALITYGYWGYFLQTYYQSPIFPFYNSLIKSPLFFDHQNFGAISTRIKIIFLWAPLVSLVNPTLMDDTYFFDLRTPLFFYISIAVFLSCFFSKVRKSEHYFDSRATFVFISLFISYIFWLWLFKVYRYLAPLEMASPILIFYALDFLFAKKGKQKLWIIASILFLTAVTVSPADWGRKKEWSNSLYKEEIDIDNNALVIISGSDAYAYLLPNFSKDETAFIRLESRFVINNPDLNETVLMKRRQSRIDKHRGSIMLFTPKDARYRILETLKSFNLKIKKGTCKTFKDTNYVPEIPAFPYEYDLCHLQKVN